MNAWFESEFRQQALQPGLTQYIAIVDWLKQNFPKYEFKTLSSGIRNIVGLGKWTDFPYLSSQHLDTNYFENKNTFTGAVSGLKINQFKTVDSQARLLLACFEADKTGGLVVKYLLENKKTPNGASLPEWTDYEELFEAILSINTENGDRKDIAFVYFTVTDIWQKKLLVHPKEDAVILNQFILAWIYKNHKEKLTLQHKLDLITMIRMAKTSENKFGLEHYGLYTASFVYLFVTYYQNQVGSKTYTNPLQCKIERKLDQLWKEVYDTYIANLENIPSIYKTFKDYINDPDRSWIVDHMHPSYPTIDDLVKDYGETDFWGDFIEGGSKNATVSEKVITQGTAPEGKGKFEVTDEFSYKDPPDTKYKDFIRTKMVTTNMLIDSFDNSPS